MIDEPLRLSVRARADNRCEYCRLPQHAVDARFHIEHVIARQHIEDDSAENLALACARCNLRKGTNLSSVDVATGDIVLLFNPRVDRWRDHFALQGAEIVGVTATGRATVRLLEMNARRRMQLRYALIDAGEF